jgi:hypothetical protein
MAPQYVKDTPSSRVLLVGSPYDADCRGIRMSLSDLFSGPVLSLLLVLLQAGFL